MKKQVAHLCAPINFFFISRLKSKIERKIKKNKIEIGCGRLTHFTLVGGALKIRNSEFGIFCCARSFDGCDFLSPSISLFLSGSSSTRGDFCWPPLLLPPYELRFVNIIDADFCKHLKTHKTKYRAACCLLPADAKEICLRVWLADWLAGGGGELCVCWRARAVHLCMKVCAVRYAHAIQSYGVQYYLVFSEFTYNVTQITCCLIYLRISRKYASKYVQK